MSADTRPSLDEVRNGDWRDDEVLTELHVRREWTPTDIARVHDTDPEAVKAELRDRGLFQDDQNTTPKFGLARQLWERGLEDGEVEIR